MSTTPNPCDDSLLSQIWKGNAVLCSSTFKNSLEESAVSQIQGVATAAKDQFGADSQSAQVAQSVADAQSSQVPTDVTGTITEVGNSSTGRILNGTCSDGSPGVDLSIVGGPCVKYSTLKEIGVGAGIALVIGFFLYASAIAAPFLPKRGR